MRLLAISDLHLSYAVNKAALEAVAPHPEDWLIVAGDVGEGLHELAQCWRVLTERFAKVFWVPGNHELWTHARAQSTLRGVAKYEACVDVCREHGVVTPEDSYVKWEGPGGPAWIIPLFLLYDYTFGPPGSDPASAIAWAKEEGIACTDERFLHPDPHPDRASWCRHRLNLTLERLEAQDRQAPWVLVNHFPLHGDLVRLPRIPRFRIWCGTRATEDWHTRFPVSVVVTGHLHMPATDWKDGVRFEEVSLGYPAHWTPALGLDAHLREIFPGPTDTPREAGPVWRRHPVLPA